MTMRKLTGLTTAVAVPGALVLALAAPTGASSSGGTVIRYLSTEPQNTDIDLGEPGLSPGDRQVFVNKAMRDGKQIGYELGEALIVEVTKNGDDVTGLKATLSSTLVLANGIITLSGLFIEDFAEGPASVTGAVTGGTGRYKGASGQAFGEFVPGTDDVKTTIRLR